MTDSEFQDVHVVHVLLHVDVAAAREVGVLVADLGGGHRQWSVRVLGAVDEAEQVAVVEELEAVHFVDDGDGASALTIRPANSKHMSSDIALMWNNRSPGVDGAWWRGPSTR